MALPLPQVVPDVGPGGRIWDVYKNIVGGSNALAKGSAEATYAPWTNYADAASKMAYSQFVGPQALASIMADPKIRGLLSKDEFDNLARAVTKQLNNPVNALSGMPVPGAQGNNNSLLGRLFNKLGVGSDQTSQNAIMQPPMQVQDNVASPEEVAYRAQYGQEAGNEKYGAGAPIMPSPSPTPLSGTSPSYTRASKNLPPGAMGAENPQAIIAAGEAGLKTQTEEEAKAFTKQWQDRQDDIKDQVLGAQEMERQLERLVEARTRLDPLLETGPLAGRIPGISSAAQESDTAESNLVAARLKAWQTNRITNMDIGFGKTLKPGRYMKDDAFNREVNYETGLAKRLQEYPAFAQVSQQLGLTPSQSDAIWARYANEKPYFDPKTGKILDNNLGEWEKYLSPQSIKETFSPSFKKQMDQYRKNMSGSDSKKDKQIINDMSGHTQEDIDFTAKKYNMTPDQVKKLLGIK